MKHKKTFLFVAVIVAITAFNVNISLSETNKLDLFSMNIEALANSESTDGDCSKQGGECSVKLPQGSQLIITGMQKP